MVENGRDYNMSFNNVIDKEIKNGNIKVAKNCDIFYIIDKNGNKIII